MAALVTPGSKESIHPNVGLVPSDLVVRRHSKLEVSVITQIGPRSELAVCVDMKTFVTGLSFILIHVVVVVAPFGHGPRPMHQRSPPLIAQVVPPETSTSVTVPIPIAAIGLDEPTIVPSPSWPAPFAPQHNKVWFIEIAQPPALVAYPSIFGGALCVTTFFDPARLSKPKVLLKTGVLVAALGQFTQPGTYDSTARTAISSTCVFSIEIAFSLGFLT